MKKLIIISLVGLAVWYMYKKLKPATTPSPLSQPKPEVNQYDNFDLNEKRLEIKRNPRQRAQFGKLANRLGVSVDDAIAMAYSS